MEADITPQNATEMDINICIADSCRICMARCSNMRYLFDQKLVNIINDIEFCTGILLKNEKRLPTKMCKICLDNLSIATNFKKACLLADKTFRKILETSVKAELPNDDSLIYNSEELMENDRVFDLDFIGDSIVKEEVCNDGIEKENKRCIRVESKVKGSEKLIKISNARIMRSKRGPYKKRKLRNVKGKVLKNSSKKAELCCVTCKLKFENKKQSLVHDRDFHGKNKVWLCEICGKVFTHHGSHYAHLKSHYPPEFACNDCDYKTWLKQDLAKHLRAHNGIKLYQCEYCTAAYCNTSNLISHIGRVHKKEKRHTCQICQKKFYDKTKLNRHIDSHNDVKRFECDVCHACFTRRCYWKKHLLRQHGVVTPPQRPGRQKTNYVVES